LTGTDVLDYDEDMRIHSDILVERDIYDACRKSGTSAPIFTRHGSHRRNHAFEVQLSGHSPYRSQGHGDYAATWDEWGVFLAHLFYTDPHAFVGSKNWNYDGVHHFNRRTNDRFLWQPDKWSYMPEDTHPRHKWWADGTGNGQYCQKCTAVLKYK
jgi:hypothetical protein